MAASMKPSASPVWFKKSCTVQLNEGLQAQQQMGTYCDVSVQAGGETLRAHACVLAIFSPYFQALLVHSQSPYSIQLQTEDGDVCGECVEKLIQYMYSGTVGVAEDHITHLQCLGKLFCMNEIVSFCEKHQATKGMKKPAVEKVRDLATDEDDSSSCGGEDAENDVMPGQVLTQELSEDFCKQYDETLVQLCKHKKSNTGKSYVCVTCGCAHQKVSDLLRHLRESRHGESTCSLCLFRADCSDSLRKHLNQHDHPKPFLCAICDLRFRTRTALRLHIPKHSTEKPWTCVECGRGFKWKHALRNHMLVHSAEKKHLCDQCGFSTSYKSTFRVHELVHSGDTFKCPHPGCAFQASRKQNLKAHLLTHSKEKPYQCEVCGQAFSLAKNMRRHALKHDSGSSFLTCPCEDCRFRTTRIDKLKEHLRKYHPGLAKENLKVVRPVSMEKEEPDKQENLVFFGDQPEKDSSNTFILTPGNADLNATPVTDALEINGDEMSVTQEYTYTTLKVPPEMFQQSVLTEVPESHKT